MCSFEFTGISPNQITSLAIIFELSAIYFILTSFESIGLFDQTFPMYAEDVDLSIRLKQKGGSIVFIPESKVWHKVSASLGGEFSIVKWKRKLIGKIKLVAKHCKLYQIPFSVLLVLFMSIFELIISLFFIIVKKD